MIIRDAAVALAAQSQQQARTIRHEQMRLWTGSLPQAASAHPRSPAVDQLALSVDARQAAQANRAEEVIDPVETNPKLRLLLLMIEKLTGQKIKTLHLDELTGHASASAGTSAQQTATAAQAQAGWGMTYDARRTYDEQAALSLSARGIAVTADGQQIAFDLDLSATRAFHSEQEVHLRAGDAPLTDPLVVNLQGLTASLTEQRFDFDLNADGQVERIPFLQPGSGFLVRLLNGQQTVRDGAQLFGPRTGDGLVELAAHDADGNGWIDEGDMIYHDLAIWTKDADGADTVTGLQDAGVGALYLGSVCAKFTHKSAETNAVQGETNRLGLYLHENGIPGSLQQLDLAG